VINNGMTSDVKSVLGSLQELNNANTVSIKVPSTGKNVSFKLASVSQQKELLRSAFDGVDGVIKRANILNKIITDNSTSDTDFLIIDKNVILIELRKASVGSDITIKDVKYDLNDLPTFKKSDVKLKGTVTHDGITAKLKVPNLTLDTEINTKLGTELAKVTDQQEKIKQSIDVVVSYETSKYIDSIKIGDAVIVFDQISSFERREIVNNLPLKLSNKILDYIGEVKEVTDLSITFDEEVIVEIDASFLSAD
tara:strand:- start:753 stop:1508 length:756 start_codon:yes stop_codon:yes gene_type:complete